MPVACGSQRTYGPYEQHLFLGLTVERFSATLGWNSQGSQVTVYLVEDPCPPKAGSTKVYYDHHFQRQEWSGADPGVVGTSMPTQVKGTPHGTATVNKRVKMWPPVKGEPVFFKFHDFEFSGIVQSHEETSDIGGNKRYVVNLSDPRGVLEGTQIITGAYNGTIMNTPNLLNVFGVAEAIFSNGISACSFTAAAANSWLLSGPGYPLGFTTGFGGSLNDENGMPWSYIKLCIHALTAQQNPALLDTSFGLFCQGGRLQFHGDMTYVLDSNDNETSETAIRLGMGYVGTDYRFHAYNKYLATYLVDLSEIPDFNEVGDVFVRTGSSTSMGLLDAIDNVCAQLGVDYYIDLMFTKNPNNPDSAIPFCFIKVRTVNKKTQNEEQKILEFVAQERAAGRPCATYSYGNELRNEVTSSFIVGGDRRDLIETNATLHIPYWGLDGNNNVIPTINPDGIINNNSYFTIATSALDIGVSTHTCTIGEIRAALVSQDAWMSYLGGNTTHPTTVALGLANYSPFLLSNNGLAMLMGANPQLLRAADFRRAKVGFPTAAEHEAIERLYQTIRNIAEEYYGKKFIVPIPQICIRYIPDDIQYLPSHEIATDGGWPSIIDPSYGYAKLIAAGGGIFFRNEDGLMQPFVALGAAKTAIIDFSEFDPNDVYYDPLTPQLFIKASVDPQFVYGTYLSKTNPYAVVSLSSPLKVRSEDSDVNYIYGGLAMILWNQAKHNGHPTASLSSVAAALASSFAGRTGLLNTNIAAGPQHLVPDYCTVPVKSNVQSYGPWSTLLDPSQYGLGLSSPGSIPVGKVHFEKDEELVPWRFGSTDNLNLVGMIKALEQYTRVTSEEYGAVRVQGYPVKPLGHEIMANDLESAAVRTALVNFITSVNSETFSIPYYTARIRDTNGDTIYTNTDVNYRGSWNGDYGPTITDIDINISIDEVSTDYKFRTYTEQVGRFAKTNIERMARLTRHQLNSSRYIREIFKPRLPRQGSTLLTGYGYGGNGGGLSNVRFGQAKGANKKKSGISASQAAGKSANVLTGSAKVLTSGSRTYTVVEVQSSDIEDAKVELSLGTNSVGMIGMEGLFRPIAIGQHASGGALPRIAMSGEVSGSITAATLNPFLHPSEVSALNLATVTADFGGHDMVYAARGTDATGTPHTSGYKIYDGVYPDYSATVYRAMALRGPLLIAGFGYDTAGKPVPNESGDNGGSDRFVDDYLRRYDLWKVGPLDARWDNTRKVWVAGGSGGATLITATLDEHMLNDTGVYNATTLGDSEIGGTGTGGESITITNILRQPVSSGTKVLLYKDEAHDTHILIRAEHHPLCVVTKVDCYTNEDGQSTFEVRGRQIFLDTAYTTETIRNDNTQEQSSSGICPTGDATFDFNPGTGPVYPAENGYGEGYVGLSAAEFGAASNTDSTDAIQETIDFAALLSYGANIFVNNGQYSLSRQSAAAANNYMLFAQNNNMSLRGEGPSTILKAASGESAAMFTTPTNVAQRNIEIRDITFDGNIGQIQWGWENYSDNGTIVISSGNQVANVYDQHAISLYNVSGVRILNVNVKGAGMDGIRLVSCIDANVHSTNVIDVGNHCLSMYYCQNVRVSDCLFINPNQSPDSGVSKHYYYSADGYAAIFIYGAPNSLITSPQETNFISVDNSQIYTVTGRGVAIDSTASDITLSHVTVESNTRVNTVLNGRRLLDIRQAGSARKRVKVSHGTFLNRDTTHSTAESIYINDADNLVFDHNHIQGGSTNYIINSSDAQISDNDFDFVRGQYILQVYGTSGSYIKHCQINDNKMRYSASGICGLYTEYMNNCTIKGNISHSLSGSASGNTYRGGVFLRYNMNSTVADNINLDGVGIMIDPSSTVSGCLIHHNHGASHVMTTPQLAINYADHNIPSGYDSATSISLGLTNSGVTFGNSIGGLSQDTNYFKYNSTTHTLYASSILTRGVLIEQSGEVEIDASGRGMILRSLNGTRWRLIVTDQGAVYTASI